MPGRQLGVRGRINAPDVWQAVDCRENGINAPYIGGCLIVGRTESTRHISTDDWLPGTKGTICQVRNLEPK